MGKDLEREVITVDTVGCSRCDGEGHKRIRFLPFQRPVVHDDGAVLYTHWAMCPTEHEPILFAIVKRPDA